MPAKRAATMTPPVAIEPIYVDIETAVQVVALSKSTIELEEREGRFPRRRQLSGRRTGFLYSELKQWAAERPVSDLPPPPNTGAKKPREKSATDSAPFSPALQGEHPAS